MEESRSRATGSRFLLTAASAVILIAGLRAAQALIIPFLIAVFLAILCAPPVLWLHRRRVPSVLAVCLVVLMLLAVLASFVGVIGGSVNEFTEAIPRYERRIDGLMTSITGWLAQQDVDVESLDVLDVIKPGAVMGFLGSGLKGVLAALSNTLLVTLTLVFMLLETAGLPAKMRAALGRRDADLSRFSRMTRDVQQYLLIKTGISLATGVTIGVWVGLVGLDCALVWGFLAFLLNYIPNLGSIIAAVPAVLLSLVQLGPGRTLLVALAFLVVNLVFGNVVEPHLLGRRLGLSTLVVFLSLVFWGWVLGPVGMLLSVPLTMIIKILLEHSPDLRWVAVMLDSGKAVEAELAAAEGPPAREAVLSSPRESDESDSQAES